MSIEAQSSLIKVLTLLKYADKNTVIHLTSYTDLIGNTQDNTNLSTKRIASVEKFLKEQGKISNKFVFSEKDTPPEGIDPIKEPQKARCVRITYEKGENNASL